MIRGDTIVAISSVAASAARIIVRSSGGQSHAALRALAGVGDIAPRSARRVQLRFDGLALPACVYVFAAPASYTGEDLVEYHIPGNVWLARRLVEELVRLGARPAEPGEFTARAYFNGRMDLTEAEGVAATIAASNEAQLRAARQLLAGELARRLRPVLDGLTETLALIEAGIDFSEEDVTFLSAEQVAARIDAADTALRDLVSQSARLDRLAHEPHFVLAGRPNAGKSTLLNALSGTQRAVVSPRAGTTRDVLSAQVQLRRGMVRVSDAAGLTELPDPADPIAVQMHAGAVSAAERADFLVLVVDASSDQLPPALPRAADLVVCTKLDLLPRAARLRERATNPNAHRSLTFATRQRDDAVAVSAVTGDNMDALRNRLDDLAFGADLPSANLTLNARHLAALAEARDALGRARQHGQPEILAVDLREALDCLGRVLGQVTPDDLLGTIFARFCIGK